MHDVWRLFAAVEISDEAKNRVATLAGRLSDAGWPARWVDSRSSHLTIKFFGNIASERVEALEVALAGAVDGLSPFPLSVHGVGVFPHTRRPRVVWLSVEDRTGALQELFERVEQRVVAAGFEPETRPFRPHVTVGRIKSDQPTAIRDVEEQLERLSRLPRITFEIAALTLFRSELTRNGPIYTPAWRLEFEGIEH